MSTKIGIGISQNLDSFTAGREAATKSFYELGRPKIDLVFVFISTIFEQTEVLRGIRSLSRDAAIIGCSTIASITSKGTFKDSVTICAINFDSIDFTCAVRGEVSKNPRMAGHWVARETLNLKTAATRQIYIMFSDYMNINVSEVLMGAQEALGTSFPIIGGSSAHDFQTLKAYQYFNYRSYEDHVAGLLLGGSFNIGIGNGYGWQPIGQPHKVTKANMNIIKEVEKKPAIWLYENYLSKTREEFEKEGIAKIGVNFPLGLRDKESTSYLLRSPIGITEDGGLILAANVSESEDISLMISDNYSMLRATRQACAEASRNINKQKASFGMVYGDISRFHHLKKDSQKEVDIIKDVLGEDVPFFGCYTYGVYTPIAPTQYIRQFNFQNQAISITLFLE